MKPKGRIAKPATSKVEAPAKAGFTIIELLTIMTIIIIIIGVLLPAVNMINWYAKYTQQRNQFKNIDTGLQSFEIDFGEYPDSSATDIDDTPYCGAMKFAEAMAGQDGLGFNPESKFTANDTINGTQLYPRPAPPLTDPAYIENLRSRREYLEAKDVQICSLTDLYGTNVGDFEYPDRVALLCDAYKHGQIRNSKRTKLGMPILYYKANTSKLTHDVNDPDNTDNIYDYTDNQQFLDLGVPWSGAVHPLGQAGPGGIVGEIFYKKTLDESALPIQRPYNKNSYILISAGGDGIYGTGGNLKTKDVFNFAD